MCGVCLCLVVFVCVCLKLYVLNRVTPPACAAWRRSWLHYRQQRHHRVAQVEPRTWGPRPPGNLVVQRVRA